MVDFRVPGIFFLPVQPEPRLPLPRLDVAAFVGFAARGPLHTPVPVEDFNTFRAIFGEDLPLAREQGGRVIFANLARAVQSFFGNGGRRCYVVRVAGDRAEAARFRLPSVVALAGTTTPRLAALSASSPGAWGAALRLATRLSVTPLAHTAFTWQGTISTPALRVSTAALPRRGPADLLTGDLMRFTLDDGSRWLASITVSTVNAVTVTAAPLLDLQLVQRYRLHDSLAASPPERVQSLELLEVEGRTPLASTGVLLDEQGRSALPLDAADLDRLGAGDIVRVFLENAPAGDLGYLTRIEEIRTVGESDSASPPEPRFVAIFSEFVQLTPEDLPEDSPAAGANPTPRPLRTLELLRLDLLLGWEDERYAPLINLAFCAPHPRFWGDRVLLGSSPLTGRSPQQNSALQQNSARSSNPDAEAAAWFRDLTRDPYDLIPLPGEDSLPQATPPRSFSPTTAYAGLLAPAGSALGVRADVAEAAAGYADAAEELVLLYLPVGLREVVTEGDPAQFRGPEAGRAGFDDLAQFDAAFFYDRYLSPVAGGAGLPETPRTLLASAFDLHYIQGRRLRGLHSLLFIDEVALISAPDAVHHPWQPQAAIPEPEPPRPAPPLPPPDCPPPADFAACDQPPRIDSVEPYYGKLLDSAAASTVVTVRGAGFTSDLDARLLFGLRAAEQVHVLDSTTLTALAPLGIRPGPVDVVVETAYGRATFAGGFTYIRNSTAADLPVTQPPTLFDAVEDAPFFTVHQALCMACHGRGDLMAVLSLPLDYDRPRCLDWQRALRQQLGLPRLEEEFVVEEPTEVIDLSFAAVYHPWLLVGETGRDASVRPVPPDGAICGMIAAREQQRQVWVAPANQPLNAILGLQTAFSNDDWADLFAHRFNLIRREAGDFRPMSAHTLSGERSLLQISVRRLLILLRKAAIQLGMDFVFESNHEIFREGIRVVLEDLLRYLFERGAFSGRTAAESYRVITDASVNPPQSVEQGRFIAVIQVAPAQPMEFITVELTRRGQGDLLVREL